MIYVLMKRKKKEKRSRKCISSELLGFKLINEFQI